MKRPYIFIMLAWLASGYCQAQPQNDVQAIKDKINEVKLDTRYLKEESQDEDEYNAKEGAFAELRNIVNQGRKERGQDSLLEKHLRPLVQLMSYKRSSMYKGFAYVLISDVDRIKSGVPFGKYFDAARVTSPAAPQEEQGKAPGNTVEIPNKDITVTAPPVDPPTPTPPTPPTPANEEASVPQPPAATTPIPTIAASSAVAKNQVLMSLSTMTVATEIYEALGEFQKESSISSYGKLGRGMSIGKDSYLIFFDKQEVVQAILQPLEGGKYKNVFTKTEETLDNYRGKGLAVLWFRF